jgi:hypothetical protein
MRWDRLGIMILAIVLALGTVIYGGNLLFSGASSLFASIMASREEKSLAASNSARAKEIEKIQSKNALDTVSVSGFSDSDLRECFFSSSIDDALMERLVSMGYENISDKADASQLSYVRVLYYTTDGETKIGEILVNSQIAQDVESIFYELYLYKYPIGKMILPDAYNTITESFSDNNTVGVCYGLSEENQSTSHAYGLAIDLNPLYNPLIKDNGTTITVYPMEGQLYLDRTVSKDYYISASDQAVKIFEKYGFVWYGQNSGLNDLKHFEKSIVSSKKDDKEETEDSQDTENTEGTENADDSSIQDDTGFEDQSGTYGEIEVPADEYVPDADTYDPSADQTYDEYVPEEDWSGQYYEEETWQPDDYSSQDYSSEESGWQG